MAPGPTARRCGVAIFRQWDHPDRAWSTASRIRSVGRVRVLWRSTEPDDPAGSPTTRGSTMLWTELSPDGAPGAQCAGAHPRRFRRSEGCRDRTPTLTWELSCRRSGDRSDIVRGAGQRNFRAAGEPLGSVLLGTGLQRSVFPPCWWLRRASDTSIRLDRATPVDAGHEWRLGCSHETKDAPSSLYE